MLVNALVDLLEAPESVAVAAAVQQQLAAPEPGAPAAAVCGATTSRPLLTLQVCTGRDAALEFIITLLAAGRVTVPHHFALQLLHHVATCATASAPAALAPAPLSHSGSGLGGCSSGEGHVGGAIPGAGPGLGGVPAATSTSTVAAAASPPGHAPGCAVGPASTPSLVFGEPLFVQLVQVVGVLPVAHRQGGSAAEGAVAQPEAPGGGRVAAPSGAGLGCLSADESRIALDLAEEVGFRHGVALLQHLRGDMRAALDAYLRCPEKEAAFDYVHRYEGPLGGRLGLAPTRPALPCPTLPYPTLPLNPELCLPDLS